MVAMPFIYDTSKGETPESVARKRMLAEQIMGRAPSAVRNVGEGIGSALTSFGNAFRAYDLNQRADTAEAAGRSSAAADEAKIFPDGRDALTRQIYGLMTGGAPYPEPAAGAGAPAPSPAPAAPQSGGKPSQSAFVEQLWPAAVEAGQATGVDPRIIVAQSAVETGWGKHAPGNNYFGIKSHGQKGGNVMATTEYVNGQPVRTQDSFRAYASPEESVRGYADFINKNPRYAAFKQAPDLDSQLNALGRSGYATDPNYASTVGQIARRLQPPMTQVASLDPNFAPPPGNNVASQMGGPSIPMPVPRPQEAPQPGTGQMALAGGMPAMGGQLQPAPQAFPSGPQLSGMPSSLPAMSASPPQPAPQMAPQQPQPAPQAPQNNERLMALFRAASDPWVPLERRALYQSMIQQEMTRRHQATDPAYQAELAYKRAQTQALERKAQGKDASFGLTPQYGVDAAGNPVLLQLGNDGTVRQPQMPDGVTLSNKPIQIDAGTHYVLLDPITRQPVGMVPKNLAGAESQKVQGKAQGEAAASLPSDLASADTTVQEIDQLLAHPGLPQIVGPLDQFRPALMMNSEGSDALARWKQLQGRAFLQAYNTLRGGGPISTVEGDKAQAAMARMDRAQGEEEFKRALADFRDAVQTGLQKMRERAGVAPGAPPVGGAASQSAPPSAPGHIQSQADYDRLPSGAEFIAPDGSRRRKP